MYKTPLRMGIWLESRETNAWVFYCIERIIGLNTAEIALVIVESDQTDAGCIPGGCLANKNRLAYLVFDRFDRKIFHQEPDAFALRNVGELLRGIPSLRLKPVRKPKGGLLDPVDLDKIKDYELDIIVDFGTGHLTGNVPAASRYGVWSYRHSDASACRGWPPALFETIEKSPETGSALEFIGTNLNEEKVIDSSWVPTCFYSPYRTRNQCFWAASSLLAKQIDSFFRLGEEEFLKKIEGRKPAFDVSSCKTRDFPSNRMVIKIAVRYLARIFARILEKTFMVDQWYLMFDIETQPGIPVSFSTFKAMTPPKDRFWSDPHVIQKGDSCYIFIEEYIYKRKKGHISVIEMDRYGNWTKPVLVLEKDYHLSYPFVFEFEGNFYMVPETRRNRTVELYESVSFPYSWRFKRNLIENIDAVDPTLYREDSRWWLFVGVSEPPGSGLNSLLHIFFSDDLFAGEWRAHSMNPVISDVKRARPAGRLFARDGRLCRPSQDSSGNYGSGININEILTLSETDYVERNIISIRPDWDKRAKGAHTYTKEGTLTVIDINRKNPRVLNPFYFT